MEHRIVITRMGDKAHADCACNWSTDLLDNIRLNETIVSHYMKIGYVVAES